MLIEDFDWRAAWADYQSTRRAPDSSDYWNNRAPSFQKTAGTSPYASEFLRLAQLRDGESVFDMGAGSGTLALPLADAGHEVFAADFSHVMMDLMMRRAEMNGTADLIHTQLLAWDDDWDQAGVPVCDVAFASRSIATTDLAGALKKLESRARRRVCLTMSGGVSPRMDATLIQVIGRELPRFPEYVYAMNLLWHMGRKPGLTLINSSRTATYESPEHAIQKNADLLDASPVEVELLEAYTEEHLHQVETPEGLAWSYDHKRTITWGFIAYDL